MAKVVSQFKLSGTIADLTFRQTVHGPVAQRKPGPDREQVKTHKNFRITRLNAAVFKKAIQDGKLLRDALSIAIDSVRHSLLNSMMNKVMHAVAKTDTRSKPHDRHATAGDLSLLAGFEFNNMLSLDRALPVKFTHSLDAVKGIAQLEVPSFNAHRKKAFPAGATHFRIVSCATVVDFEQGRYVNSIKTTALLPLSKKTPATIYQDHRLTVQPGKVLLQVMGIEFYRVVDDKAVLLKGGAMKILEAVQVEKAGESELQDTPVMHKIVKPYTAKELQKITNRVLKRMPIQVEALPAVDNSVACCYDSMLEKLPDIV
jgi:hypothetical protein